MDPKKCKEAAYARLQLKNPVQDLSEQLLWVMPALGTTDDHYSVELWGGRGDSVVWNKAVSLPTKPPLPGLTSSPQNPSMGDFAV